MTGSALRVPITNVYGGGDYTAQIEIGSIQTKANVILDTGSSTLAVVTKVYDVVGDSVAKPTPLAQDVIYGTGGWAGPVVTTNVALAAEGGTAALDTYLAIAIDDERRGFGAADGILGLAYNVLNSAYNLSAYLEAHGGQADTYPWPFPVRNTSAAIQRFATFLSRMPQEDLPPYFTALANAGIAKNLFAFRTLRSVPSARTAKPETDPLNQGLFIMGGGPEQTDLYTGQFQDVAVVDDAWYNTDLLSVRVGSAPAYTPPPLSPQFAKTMGSNSIVDSGTNSLALSNDVLNAVITALQHADPAFGQAIQQAQRQGAVPAAGLGLDRWPAITFTLRGPTGQAVPLTCAPSTYWQVDCPQAGQAVFLIGGSGMPQSILGLPLMNNYYCVFDRTNDPQGVIRFAPAAPAA